MSNPVHLEEKSRIRNMLTHERFLWARGIKYVVGVDEAGRGPLAGPVVAAAVVFQKDVFINGMNDSKKLTERRRESLYDIIHKEAISIGTGIISEKEIDEINILQASLKAMQLAVKHLSIIPDHLLIDGNQLPDIAFRQTCIVRGDQLCFSIAAASVIAKVTRDRMMIEFDEDYPEYGFARHKGYGTRKHLEAIRRYGLCGIHRRSFNVTGWKDV